MSKVSIDFSNVKDFEVVPEGTYVAKIKKTELKTAQSGDSKYFAWEADIIDGEYKGSKLWWNTSLKPQALFNLRNMLEACGIEVPKSKFQVDTDLIVGRTIGLIVENETYKGKEKAVVVGYVSADEAGSTEGTVNFDADVESTVDSGDIDLEGLDL